MWDYDKYRKYSEEDMMHDLFEVGHADMAILQSTYLTDFYDNGFNTTAAQRQLRDKYPDKFILNGSFEPASSEAASRSSRRSSEKYNFTGRQALHRRVARRLAGLEARRLRGP